MPRVKQGRKYIWLPFQKDWVYLGREGVAAEAGSCRLTFHLHTGNRERERGRGWTGSGSRLQNLIASIQHFSSSEAASPKGSRTFPDSEANWGPSAPAYEPGVGEHFSFKPPQRCRAAPLTCSTDSWGSRCSLPCGAMLTAVTWDLVWKWPHPPVRLDALRRSVQPNLRPRWEGQVLTLTFPWWTHLEGSMEHGLWAVCLDYQLSVYSSDWRDTPVKNRALFSRG